MNPLLVCCALAPEEWALRGGDWAGALGGAPVLARTGMGPERAAHAARALFAPAVPAYGAVLVAGFCAAVAPGFAPGDLVVAEEVRAGSGRTLAVDSPQPLVDALRLLGLTVHRGPLYSADHVVRGAERRELYRAGSVAVDMESAAILAALPAALPVAVLRVVVDTPERELLRPGTLPAGLRAWRALRAAVPAMIGWHRAVAGPAARASIPEPSDLLPLTHSSLPTLPQEAS
ncbi:nucleoside phosphorylase [Kitasatospora sp. MAP12-15]|uniref:phosphorylase family protein n=1 Tax=unclassified Kitasatospora TaxID=2633591 RepID=UPI002473C3AB|nr:1-hydroxy-2-methyl-2-butenyl 4-diphosphate reductase [Kitasatospora sp. MAP12-44]MDH6109161.1 nucleoside phosphorylase [Kitasatospora sp. MAP12-44]